MSENSETGKNAEMRENINTEAIKAGSETGPQGHGEKKMRKKGPLLTVMLSLSLVIAAAVSLADINNTYSEYRRNHENVPAVLTCVGAVSEKIFPWTQITVYAAPSSGYVNEGPGVPAEETEAETASLAEREEKPAETVPVKKEETKLPETQAETVPEGPGAASGMTGTGDSRSGEERQFTTVDMSYFSDAVFVGDSFTQGLMLYAEIPGADFLCYQSKTTRNIMDSEIHLRNGGISTVRKELSGKQYGKVYIMLGINELSSDAAGFTARYQKVISEIRALQPNAVIFIQSILHTTPNKSAGSNFKNDIIDLNNQALKGLADNRMVFFVDVNPPFDDGTGAMRADYSGDGVHLKASRYKEWRDYLLNFGIR